MKEKCLLPPSLFPQRPEGGEKRGSDKAYAMAGDNAVDVADLLPDHNFHHKDGELIIHQNCGEVRIPKGGWFIVDDAGYAHKDD